MKAWIIDSGVDAGSMVALARQRLARVKPARGAASLVTLPKGRWPRRPNAARHQPLGSWLELRPPTSR